MAERREVPDWTIVEKAKMELQKEAEERAEEKAAAERHERLIQETRHIRFWHYCEVCGKKELLKADEALCAPTFPNVMTAPSVNEPPDRTIKILCSDPNFFRRSAIL